MKSSKNGDGPIDFSYSSLPVSCVSAYLPDTAALACTSGMFTALGNDIIYNFNQTDQSKVKKFDEIKDNLSKECLQNVCINAVLRFSINKLPAIRKALKWYFFSKLISKTLNTNNKKMVGEILENFSGKVEEGILVEIINTSSDDITVILNQIKSHLDNGGKIDKIDQIIYLIDSDNKKLFKFVGGKWLNGVGNLLNAEGKFIDNLLEADYAKYLTRKATQGKTPRGRLDWKEASDYFKYDSPLARGNAFNKKAVDNDWYEFNEVTLANGKRVDGYTPPTNGKPGEIVSRKATNLEEIELATFEGYLKEMKTKYPAGEPINAPKYGNDLKGKVLEGNQILEIPASNQNFNQIQDYIDLAKNKYSIEIRFKPE